MKKTLLSLLAAFALALPVHGQNIAVVDVSGVFNNLTQVQTKLAQLQSSADDARNFLKDKLAVVNDLNTKINQIAQQLQNPAITEETKNDLRKQGQDLAAQLDAKKNDATDFLNNSQDMIKNRQEDLVKAQLDRIRTAVADIAAKKGLSLVLNSSNIYMQSAVFYSGKNITDITTEVRDTLNAQPATDASPAPAKPAASSGTSH